MCRASAGEMRASTTDAVHHLNSAADPPHHRHRHRIANRPVSRTVRSRLPAIKNQRVIVWHALQPLALARGQPPDRQSPANREQWSAIASATTAGVRLERWHKFGWTAPAVSRQATLETHSDLTTCV